MKRWKAFMLVLCFAGTSSLFAVTNSWNGGDGAWDNQVKWSLNLQPSSSQDIVITNTGTFSVTVDDSTASNSPSSMMIQSLDVSNVLGTSTLVITNRPASTGPLTLTVLLDARFATGSVLRLADASTLGFGVRLFASNLFNNSAISIATNAILSVTNHLSVGTSSNQVGTLTTAGGLVNAPMVSLGDRSGALGTWTILDGTNLVGETLQIGSDNGTGILNQTGGKLIVGGNASDYAFGVAGSPDSTGVVILAQGQVPPISSVAVGERGRGELIVSNGNFQTQRLDIGVHSGAYGVYRLAGGTNVVTNYGLSIAAGAGTTGEVWVTGGRLDVSNTQIGVGAIDVGNGPCGAGNLVISNGVVAVGYLGIAECPASVGGTVTLAGGSVAANLVSLGGNSKGALWIKGGQLTVTGALPDGRIDFRYGSGSQLICSGGMITAREVDLGFHAPQQSWEIAGGTNSIQEVANVLLGVCKISGGRLELPLLRVGHVLFVGDGDGQVIVSGGEVQVSQGLIIGAGVGSPALTSVVTVAGGRLTVGNLGSSTTIGSDGAGQMVISSGTFTTGSILLGGNNGSSGTLSVTGGVAQSSVAWLGGANGASGKMIISGGSVDVGSASFGQGLFVGYAAGSTGTVLYNGGNLLARAIKLGDAGFGSMFVASNVGFQPLGVIVGNQSTAAGTLSMQGGTPSTRQILDLEIGLSAGSTGSVWITDGALVAGTSGGCFPGNIVTVGKQGSGRLSATNSSLYCYNLTVGNKGTLECVNSQFNINGNGCLTINSNLMRFVGSLGSVFGDVQNYGTMTAEGSTLTFFGSVNNGGTIIATNGAVQFLGGISNSGNVVFGSDQFLVTSTVGAGNNVVVSWRAFGGNRYRVQVTTNFPASYSDISPEIIAAGSGFSATNYIDVGALTNFPSRVYRIRQVL